MLSTLKCDSIMLSSVLAEFDSDVIDLYKDTIAAMQTPMAELTRKNGDTSPFPWTSDISYIDDINHGNMIIKDYHPPPLVYYEYLSALKFNVTDKSFSFAKEADERLRKVILRSELFKYWPYVKESRL